MSYQGPIKVGQVFIWEKDTVRAWARVKVTKIEPRPGDETRIHTLILKTTSGKDEGREVWNDISRFREAVTEET